ncbi:hypothetical protein [Acinetobacter baumannii]|uniref:hypothetical protein n=1 Tax=Acinetobacter baumannii TaxID=470 RepID=UPI00148E497D|nr:hypothetical protein [Acinetobacter baumannii]
MKLFIVIFIAIFSSIGLICLIALLRNLKSYSPSGEHDYSVSTHPQHHLIHDNSHHSSHSSNDCSSFSDSGGCDGGGSSD